MNKRKVYNRCFLIVEKTVVLLMIFSFVFSPLSSLITNKKNDIAEAAQVSIDAFGFATGDSHFQTGTQTVFIDDQTGYKFFRSAAQTGVSNGQCVYRKTTDGGATWATPVLIDDQTDCLGISVWYDRWTPGDTTGNYIHIATFENLNSDDVSYNRIDTANSDTRLTGSTAVKASTNPAQTNTNTLGAASVSITKATNGQLFIAQDDTTDSFVVRCPANCQTTTRWVEAGTRPQDLANDYSLLMPLTSGDILIINRDISTERIRSKRWSSSTAAWDTNWKGIGRGTDNTVYDIAMAATLKYDSANATTTLYLAFIADNATLGTDDDIRTHRYSGGNWATTTAVVTNDAKGITNVAIARDQNSGAIYVGYTGRTTAVTANTGNVYWKSSRDDMTTWTGESPVMNTTADDMYGMDLNIMSDQRIYASWFDNTDDDIFGDTLADLVPGVLASTTGSQIGTTTAAFTNTHIGGTFSLLEQVSSRDVTNITITENGTIDAQNSIENIKLFYESDTTSPYNCASVSYGGTEAQFGSTDTNGFSGTNGTAAFSGTSVTVSTTSAMCVYVVLDVTNNANQGEYLNVVINDPSSDITVTGGGEVGPSTPVNIRSATGINNDNLTQIHYHWRNDNALENAATSKTSGVEDTSFTGYQRTGVRLRMEVSNEGNVSSPATAYRLEYALSTTTCAATTGGWTDVGATDDDWNMNNSTFLTDGNNTTNIAAGIGGVTNENTTFLTPNGGVKDTSSQTGSLTLSNTQYVELEYSIIASSTAADGNTYCFRLTDAGTPLKTYTVYPSITITADVNLSVSGTQTATVNVPSTNQYLGGTFVFTDGTGAHTINSITIKENGTVDGQNGLDNILLRYDLDTTAPYDCASESYSGAETQFGSTDTDGFSGANGTSTFTGTLSVTTTQTACVYVVTDVTTSAANAETVEVEVSNATTDIVLASGGTAPSIPRAISGATTLQGAVLTQSRYHWRNDNGTQATATSQTAGVENTPIDYIDQNTQVRLRMEVSNEGAITSPNTALRLEYGTKITACSAVSSWTDVGAAGGAFDMYNSIHMTEGGNTTNISNTLGGVTDDNSSFKATNAGLKDTSSQVATTTLTSTEFIETEFSIRQTASAAYDATYCFRLSNAGANLNAYTAYPELTTSPERDFEIQRGTANFSATSTTLRAGINYVAPASSTRAFVRITNTHHTGAGDSSTGGTQNADDTSVYIRNPASIGTLFTLQRPAAALATTTRVSWEIVEYIGAPGGDNEFVVRDAAAITYGTNAFSATGTAVTSVDDDNDVVVFITGQFNPDTGVAAYNAGQSTSRWLSASDQPVFQRGRNATTSRISYAVVEFNGPNWKIQRASHTYTAAGTTETESITALNSLNRSFMHTQKRMATALTGTDEFGHEVWLSSIGAVSFFLTSGATTPSGQTSVAWIIENTQTTIGAMNVYRSDGFSNAGVEPLTVSVEIQTGVTLEDLSNASIFTNSRAAGTGTLYPHPIAGITIASSTHYQVWRSDTGGQLNYRTEVIEWPTAGLSFRQNDWRFYVDNDALLPTDPWPAGASDLGENSVLTGSDGPLGDQDNIRIRMNLTTVNATFPEESLAFKLQFGERTTTCSAIAEEDWFDIGGISSSAIWRGYDASGVSDGATLSSDPVVGGELLLTSSSDIGASYEESNTTVVNPHTAEEGEDVEYDWNIQMNGAPAETFYCFRMIRADGTVLGGYNDPYPQLRTSSFTAKTQNWRFYSDVNNETPTTALAAENTAPIDIGNASTTKLRVTVKETENIARDDVRFRLQYSEYADFSVAHDVLATSTCVASSTWCYYDGGGSDNAVISTKVLSDADACAAGVGDGCGTHNEQLVYKTGFRHENGAATEYEFTLTSGYLRANAVYYFRLYDIIQDIPVPINDGEAYPSVVAAGPTLSFNVTGLSSGITTEGVTLDITSTPSSIAYGELPLNTDIEAGYRLAIITNATEGYQMYMTADHQLLNSHGQPIAPITGTNAVPATWVAGCTTARYGCFGYHVGDDTLANGSARFAPNDTYAGLATSTLEEVMYSSIPTSDTYDIVFKTRITDLQQAGDYETVITYIAVPVH